MLIPPIAESLAHNFRGERAQDRNWDYQWDGAGRLVRAVSRDGMVAVPEVSGMTIDFVYDADGRRTEKTVTSTTSKGVRIERSRVLYAGWLPILERRWRQEAGQHGLAEINRRWFQWGPDRSGTLDGAGGIGGLMAIHEENTGGQFVRTLLPVDDGLGNIVAVLDGDGSSVATFEHGPFGEPIAETGEPDVCPFRWQTKWYDPELKDYYFGYRYYDPRNGRWLSRDPLGEAGGFNRYAYCGNDPINRWDYLGLDDNGTGPGFLDRIGVGMYYLMQNTSNPVEIGKAGVDNVFAGGPIGMNGFQGIRPFETDPESVEAIEADAFMLAVAFVDFALILEDGIFVSEARGMIPGRYRSQGFGIPKYRTIPKVLRPMPASGFVEGYVSDGLNQLGASQMVRMMGPMGRSAIEAMDNVINESAGASRAGINGLRLGIEEAPSFAGRLVKSDAKSLAVQRHSAWAQNLVEINRSVVRLAKRALRRNPSDWQAAEAAFESYLEPVEGRLTRMDAPFRVELQPAAIPGRGRVYSFVDRSYLGILGEIPYPGSRRLDAGIVDITVEPSVDGLYPLVSGFDITLNPRKPGKVRYYQDAFGPISIFDIRPPARP